MPYELTYNFLTLSMRHPISVSQSSDSMRYAMLRSSCDVQIVLVRVFPFFGKSISRVTITSALLGTLSTEYGHLDALSNRSSSLYTFSATKHMQA